MDFFMFGDKGINKCECCKRIIPSCQNYCRECEDKIKVIAEGEE